MTNPQTEARAIVEAGCQDAAERGWFTGTVNARACIAEHVATAIAAKNAELTGALEASERFSVAWRDAERRAERAESQLAELEKAGAPMANILYNCASHASLPDTTRKSMHEAREEWDNAIRAARRALEQGEKRDGI